MNRSRLEELQFKESRLRHSGDWDGALGVLDEMIALDPSFSPALNNKAAILMMHRRYKEALPVLEKATAVDPSNGQAFNNLAYCLYATGQPEEAIPLYRKAIELGYRHEGVHYNLGLAFFALGDMKDALNEWRLVLRQNPLHDSVLSELYRLAQATGAVKIGEEVDEATIDQVEKALADHNISILRHTSGPEMNFVITRKRT